MTTNLLILALAIVCIVTSIGLQGMKKWMFPFGTVIIILVIVVATIRIFVSLLIWWPSHHLEQVLSWLITCVAPTVFWILALKWWLGQKGKFRN